LLSQKKCGGDMTKEELQEEIRFFTDFGTDILALQKTGIELASKLFVTVGKKASTLSVLFSNYFYD